MTQLTEEVDANIPRAVQCALGVKVLSSEWIKLGIVNRVYRVESDDGRFVVKVFRSGRWPEAGKLQWIEKQLSSLRILHPRILFSSRDAVFPNGFMITEHIDGRDAWEAIDDGSLTTERFCEALGHILRRVHSVRVKAFGHVCDGRGVYSRFIEQRLERTPKDVDQLAGLDGRDQDFYDIVRYQTRQRLLPFEHLYRPVLTHGDPNPHNCILTESGQLALVDWDNAASSVWLRDYAQLTYRLLKSLQEEIPDKNDENAREVFLKAYGATDFDCETIRRIERTFHIIWDYNSLSRAELRNDPEAFGETKERLLRLLREQ